MSEILSIYFFLNRHSRIGGNLGNSQIQSILLTFISMNPNWIPAYAPQGHSDSLSAEALAKSYAGMTKRDNDHL